MVENQSVYKSQYKEKEIIGRGNFGKIFFYYLLVKKKHNEKNYFPGSATLVQDNADSKIYIAKKIVLAGLKDKEK